MEFDSVPFTAMSPDSSQWQKGLHLVVNAAPFDGGSWRELLVDRVTGSATVPSGSVAAGAYGAPDGAIYAGTSNAGGPTSRLYEITSAGVATNRTPGTDFAGAPARWLFSQFGPTVIATPDNSSGSTLRMQAKTGAANFAALVTSADIPVPRYIGNCHNHMIGAYNQAGGAGVYGSADAYQFMWSARNNAAVWTPGVDRAGFSPVNNELGEVTGLCCFDDFFLLFQEFGVTRYTWVGGDFVWEAQGIGSHPWGLTHTWSPSIVRADRDAYYWSRSGLALVVGGEQVVQVGAGSTRRFFTDRLATTALSPSYWLNTTLDVQGAYEPESGLLVWTGWKEFGPTFQIAYHPASDRFSVLDGQQAAVRLAIFRKFGPSRPLESLGFVGMNGATLEVRQLTPPTSGATLAQDLLFYTSRVRPATGKRVSLEGIRPVAAFGAPTDPSAEVAASLSLARYMDPYLPATDTTTFSLLRNESGWINGAPLPLEGAEFQAVLTFTGVAGAGLRTMLEAPALEYAYKPSSTDF